MNIIHEIPARIMKHAKDGESIRSLAARIGFAYSAVYKWVHELERYDVIQIITQGNKTIMRVHKNAIYEKYQQLAEVISVVEKDKAFWEIMEHVPMRTRFVQGTAATIWTSGSFITGDFYDRIYFVEVDAHDVERFKSILREHDISCAEEGIGIERPFVFIIPKKNIKIERKNGLPIMPLTELVRWCKRLQLENVLEQLNTLYHLRLKARYAEVATNV